MTSSHTPEIAHHGDATVSIEVHDGALEAIIEIEGKRLVVADAQNRDLMLCLADLYPSLLPMREPARVGQIVKQLPGNDTGAPIYEISMPLKPCGCGVFMGEQCDCYSGGRTR